MRTTRKRTAKKSKPGAVCWLSHRIAERWPPELGCDPDHCARVEACNVGENLAEMAVVADLELILDSTRRGRPALCGRGCRLRTA